MPHSWKSCAARDSDGHDVGSIVTYASDGSGLIAHDRCGAAFLCGPDGVGSSGGKMLKSNDVCPSSPDAISDVNEIYLNRYRLPAHNYWWQESL